MLIRCVALAALYAFNYGGRPAEGLDDMPVVRTLRDDDAAKTVVREWTSPDGRLVLRSTETEYQKFPVVEYVPELVAAGDGPTGVVDGFRTLDFHRAGVRTVLRALRGTVCSERDFEPVTQVLGTGKGETNAFAMVATEGRPSAQWMPWWGIDFPEGDGLEIGLGWTGAWRADFAADGKAFSMSAGMVRTHFRLLPGETIRQPSLLVFRRAKGVTPLAMQTLIHRFMVDVKSPRDSKGELIHGISAITAGGGNKTPEMMRKIIDWKVANDMPFDCFWVDAGWNGPAHMPDLISNCGNMWYNFTGDWRFNPTVHPDGDLGKVADAAHAAGLRMLLWMEPERCVSDPPPPVFREHRDWLLPKRDADIRNKRQLCVDFGNPAALEWAIETASEHVRRCKLDVFRQDFNLNTLPLWQANDAPDRQGITEAKHVMGLWRFWDTLRARFPHLVVENCASGGRRLDFEAVSRGHSYCRTDYAIYHRGPSQITDVQNVSLNTLAYAPFQGSESTPAAFFDDYGIFSAFASGNVFTPSDWNAGIVKNDFTPEQVAWLRESFATGRRMMPFYEGDFYPLTDSREAVRLPHAWFVGNPEESRWCAWQMHRADRDAGFAIFFRRLNTPNSVFEATLGGIDEAGEYEVETWHGETVRMPGRELRRQTVVLRQPRSFRLVFYRRAEPAERCGRTDCGLVPEIDAAKFGFAPGNGAADNARALQKALDGGRRKVVVSKPGAYGLDRTIYIDDDTTLEFAEGVVLSKEVAYANVLANRGAFFGGRNRNIVIRGANVAANGHESVPPVESRACGLRGLLGFYGVDGLELHKTVINDFGTSQYAVQVVDFDGLLIDGFELRGDKDGIHLNCGRNFVIRNGRLRTYDDGIAINAGEWPANCTPRMGSITDGLIENVEDEPGGHCNFARVITGAWMEWRKGMRLQHRDIFTRGQDVYAVYPAKVSTNETVSLTPPTHKHGVWKSPEGINFYHCQSDGCRRADIRRVTFRNIRMNCKRSISCSWEVGAWARLIHPDLPREDYPVIDIRLENVVKTASGPIVCGNADADIVFERCRSEKGPLVSMGWSKAYRTQCPVRRIVVDGVSRTVGSSVEM